MPTNCVFFSWCCTCKHVVKENIIVLHLFECLVEIQQASCYFWAFLLLHFRNMAFQLIWGTLWLHTILGSTLFMFNFMMLGRRSGISKLPAQKSFLIWNLHGIEGASFTRTLWWAVWGFFCSCILQSLSEFLQLFSKRTNNLVKAFSKAQTVW